ncbi:MAG: PilX N-terminal domain-containing pilus assembly protein [candidate division NC10 bacterium]|nr:PilX N-terminal domain-containing pilus assembly protein [candidate division NC10 bacterium]
MKQFSGQGIREQRGIVLVIAMLVMAILSILGLAFLMTAQTEDAIATNYRNHTAAFYAAEAGVESGIVSLRGLLGGNPIPTDAQLTAIVPAALTDPGYTFNAFQVRRVRTVAPYSYQTTLTTGAYAGLMAWTTDYEVTATVTGPRGSQARVTQKIQHVGIPLFQFIGFYGRGVDLELAPGPAMTLNGRVHANSNLYLKAGTELKIDSYVTTTGDIYRYVKGYGMGDRGVSPQIKDAMGNYQTLNFDHEYNYNFANTWSESDWKSAALSAFGDRVQDSAMGVQEILPPIPDALYDPKNADKSSHLMIEKGSAGDSQALKDAKLYYKADLIIEGTKAYDQAGNEVKIDHCEDSKGKKAVRKEKFYDAREKNDMEVSQLDIAALTACGVMPKNGILYVSAKEWKPKKDEGVRLVNGAELPKQGLTVVSENPVYIQGDYNTVNKVPAAVLGDAITVLSNSWEKNGYDKKGKDVTSSRKAAATTVNAAFATGPSHESVMDKSNGQMNNLIRFLEHWTDVDFTYNGSLVALWHSQNATEWFRCCGDGGDLYYTPPNRIWSYETLFNTKQPPGAPMGIIYIRGQWSQG